MLKEEEDLVVYLTREEYKQDTSFLYSTGQPFPPHRSQGQFFNQLDDERILQVLNFEEFEEKIQA